MAHKAPIAMADLHGVLVDDAKPSAASEGDYAPESRASWFSRVIFSYMDPIFRLGSVSALQHTDLPGLTHGDRAAAVLQRVNVVESPRTLASLFYSGFKAEFFLTGLFKFTNSSIQFLPPLVLNRLLNRMEDEETEGATNYLLACLFIVLYVVRALVENQYFLRATRVAFRIRAALTTMVYDKALRLSPWARQQSTVGEVVNLMQLDCEKVERTVSTLWAVPDGIYQLTGYSVFLVMLIGPSMLSGIAVMIAVVPFMSKVAVLMAGTRRKLVKLTDRRVKLENEVLTSIAAVKLYHWEDSFHAMAAAIRREEVVLLKEFALYKAAHSAIMMSAPALVAIAALLTYSSTGGDMRPSIVFTALVYFEALRFPLLILPFSISNIIDARVSQKRLCRFLSLTDAAPTDSSGEPGSIRVVNGTFNWAPEDAEPALRDVTLRVEPGQLVAVVGRVGCGKSALVSSLLGDLFRTAGEVSMAGKVAYVSQTPWVLNDTLRNNILFGRPFDAKLYRSTISVCALQPDIDILPDGHDTMIGERGINLSGGQKQRVALARAVYAEADVYLLDDPLSALDAHVGLQVFNEAIKGVLKSKTVLLVTNDLGLLNRVDHIVALDQGTVAGQGTVTELEQLLDLVPQAEGEEQEQEAKTTEASGGGESASTKSVDGGKSAAAEASKAAPDKMMQVEERRTGAVKLEVYKAYIRTGGVLIFLGVLAVALVSQLSVLAQSWWLSEWTSESDDSDNNVYMLVYAVLGVSIAVFSYFRSYAFALLGVRASTQLHNGLFERILHAPMSFFDTTPIGRIISRFSKDLDSIDQLLPGQFNMVFVVTLLTLGTLAIIVAIVPLILIAIVPLALLYFRIMNYFRSTSRELKRLDSIMRSPVYANFSQTLGGLPIIRAFGDSKRFLGFHESLVDGNNMAYFCLKTSDRWLSVRLETVGATVVCLTSLLVVASSDVEWLSAVDINASRAAWVISTSMALTQFLSHVVRFLSETEMLMNSVERVTHYTDNTEQEAPWDKLTADRAASAEKWPANGVVEFDNVVVRYRPTTPRVLHGVTFTTTPGEKVGIAGRSGCGKSTILLTLFRMLELESGAIRIDGVDIATLGLSLLRRSISIIPQLPVLFSGTVRSNLDPFGEYQDEQLWTALEQVQLKEVVKGLGDLGLANVVAEAGENFSVGQRQLICLCRVLLRNTKILVLDEATSSVDHATDAVIQSIIKAQFQHATILTIAHRVNTIMASDRIMVIDEGRVAELDTPAALMARDSVFAGLVGGGALE